MKNKVLTTLAVFALIFAAVSIARTNTAPRPSTPERPPPESEFSQSIAGVGLVESDTENISIGSPLSEIISEVSVVVAQRVRLGDPLFRLDVRQSAAELRAREAKLKVAEAEVKIAEAAVSTAEAQLSFIKGLQEDGAVSGEQATLRRIAVDSAHANLERAKAEVDASDTAIAQTRTEIERSIVRSPIDGVVLKVNVRPGEYAQAGIAHDPLIVMGGAGSLRLRVDVDERDAWKIKDGSAAVALLRGNSSIRTPIRFLRVEPLVIPKKSLTGDSTERVDTRVLQVIYEITDRKLPLRVGQQMDVFIAGELSASADGNGKINMGGGRSS